MDAATPLSDTSRAHLVDLQHMVPGAASAGVTTLESGREVVWLAIDGAIRKGALSADASHVIVTAADTARTKGLPLVLETESSGVGEVPQKHLLIALVSFLRFRLLLVLPCRGQRCSSVSLTTW
jgi:acetyl-CoA carboxylase carboxyltransferase component